jgi:hypothetical protein
MGHQSLLYGRLHPYYLTSRKRCVHSQVLPRPAHIPAPRTPQIPNPRCRIQHRGLREQQPRIEDVQLRCRVGVHSGQS